jgi:hypothetical protein
MREPLVNSGTAAGGVEFDGSEKTLRFVVPVRAMLDDYRFL